MGHPGRLHLRSIAELRPTWLCQKKKAFPRSDRGSSDKGSDLSVGSMQDSGFPDSG